MMARYSSQEQLKIFKLSAHTTYITIRTDRINGITNVATMNKDERGKLFIQTDSVFALWFYSI